MLRVALQLCEAAENDPNSDETIISIQAFHALPYLFNAKANKPNQDANKRFDAVIRAGNPSEAVIANLPVLRYVKIPHPAVPVNPGTLSLPSKTKISKHIRGFQTSDAMRMIESISKGDAPVTNFTDNPEVMETLRGLHPKRDPDRDNLPIPDQDNTAVNISKEDLLAHLSKLPPNKAASMSGWTFELIKSALSQSDPLTNVIVRLFNLLVNGKAGPASIWLASRLIPIKKGAGGIRPIAVTDCWIRFLAGFLAKKFAPDAAQAFAPLQFGVGVPGGAEIMVHAAQTAVKYTAGGDGPHLSCWLLIVEMPSTVSVEEQSTRKLTSSFLH